MSNKRCQFRLKVILYFITILSRKMKIRFNIMLYKDYVFNIMFKLLLLFIKSIKFKTLVKMGLKI